MRKVNSSNRGHKPSHQLVPGITCSQHDDRLPEAVVPGKQPQVALGPAGSQFPQFGAGFGTNAEPFLQRHGVHPAMVEGRPLTPRESLRLGSGRTSLQGG